MFVICDSFIVAAMNSVVCVFGVLSVTMASAVLPPDVYTPQKVILHPPFCFGYFGGETLNVLIDFSNLSPNVIYTIYETDFWYNSFLAELHTNKGLHTYKAHIQLQKGAILFYLELKTTAGWCKNIVIFEGRSWLPNMTNALGYEYNDLCLRSLPCTIEMDLKNDCLGSPYDTSDHSPIINKPITANTTAMPVTVEENLNNKINVITSPLYGSIATTTSKNTAGTKSADNLTQSSLKNVFMYVIPTAIVILVIILLIYISIKKYCHRNLHPAENTELNTYTTANQVVYADLSLLRGVSQPPRRDEESPYAQIIGVMKP